MLYLRQEERTSHLDSEKSLCSLEPTWTSGLADRSGRSVGLAAV